MFSWFSGFGFTEWWSGRDGGRSAPVTHPVSITRGGPGKRRPVLCSSPTPELSFTKGAVSELGPGGNSNRHPWKWQLSHPVPGQVFMETHSPAATSNAHWDQRPELSDWGAAWSQHRWEKFSFIFLLLWLIHPQTKTVSVSLPEHWSMSGCAVQSTQWCVLPK